MKKRLAIFLSTIIFLFTLTACFAVPVGWRSFASMVSQKSNFMKFSKGNKGRWWIINDRKTEIVFLFSPNTKTIYRKKSWIEYETILIAHISSVILGLGAVLSPIK